MRGRAAENEGSEHVVGSFSRMRILRHLVDDGILVCTYYTTVLHLYELVWGGK